MNCDDFGSMHGTNVAIIDALRSGATSSTTLMVPCPWAAEAAAMAEPGDDIGVHLTVTSEWAGYRWAPITRAPSLCAPDGRMHRTVDACFAAVAEAGDRGLDEVYAECAAQIEQAMAWGIDVTHLDAHMGAMQMHPAFLEIYLRLASEHRLPVRMMPAASERDLALDGRRIAGELGVVFPDHLLMTYLDARPTIERAIAALRPGVTEFLVPPSTDNAEVHAACNDAQERLANDAFLRGPESFAEQVREAGATMIGFRPLRDLQRGLQPA